MEKLKKFIIIGCFITIMLIGIVFIISTGTIIIVLLITGLTITRLCNIWKKSSKKLMKKETKNA